MKNLLYLLLFCSCAIMAQEQKYILLDSITNNYTVKKYTLSTLPYKVDYEIEIYNVFSKNYGKDLDSDFIVLFSVLPDLESKNSWQEIPFDMLQKKYMPAKKLFDRIYIKTYEMDSKKDDNNNTEQEKGKISLQFENYVGKEKLSLGVDANTAKTYTSNGQTLKFSEVKYVISNIRLIKTDGTIVGYNSDNLDTGAFVLDQAKPASLKIDLNALPVGQYKAIYFDYGIRKELNNLDEAKFPKFYKAAGKNDTQMHWEWGKGYRFTKIEGFWGTQNKPLSIHTGSTIKDRDTKRIGVDACRTIKLAFSKVLSFNNKNTEITIIADFDKLLNGTKKITLTEDDPDNNPNHSAIPSTHSALQMVDFVNNMAGDNQTNTTGMFKIAPLK